MKSILNTFPLKIIAGAFLIVSTSFHMFAQNNQPSFSIGVETSLAPLAEGWIQKYTQFNPGVTIILKEKSETGPQADVRLFKHYDDNFPKNEIEITIKIGQLPILPVINQNNRHFSREQRRGISTSKLNEIFFSELFDWLNEDKDKKEPEYAVYTPMPQSLTAEAFSEFYNKQSTDLKGVYVSGGHEHLLSAILQDPDAISYILSSHIFDFETRKPIEGLKVLPVDLNNNGRLDKNEQIFDNLDLILQYFEETQNPVIPSVNISLALSSENLTNPEINNFLKWIKSDGQDINQQLGFISDRNMIHELLYSNINEPF